MSSRYKVARPLRKKQAKDIAEMIASWTSYLSQDISTPHNVGSVLWRLFSTLEVVQYIGGITSVLWGDSFSTVGDSFSTVEVVQYSGG